MTDQHARIATLAARYRREDRDLILRALRLLAEVEALSEGTVEACARGDYEDWLARTGVDGPPWTELARDLRECKRKTARAVLAALRRVAR